MTIFILSAWEESSYDTWTWESRWDLVLRWEASCGAATWTVKGSLPLCLRKHDIDAVALSLFASNCFYPGAISPKLCLLAKPWTEWTRRLQVPLATAALTCLLPLERGELSPRHCPRWGERDMGSFIFRSKTFTSSFSSLFLFLSPLTDLESGNDRPRASIWMEFYSKSCASTRVLLHSLCLS